MARCRVRRFRRSVRGRLARFPAVWGNPHGKRYDPTLERLAGRHTHQRVGVVGSSSCHCCRSVSPGACSNRHLDHRAHLDGDGVHSECKEMRTHPLPLHGTLLSRHDRTGARACFESGFRRFLWMACIGCSYSCRKQDHLVGYRAGVGKILVDSRYKYLAYLRNVRLWYPYGEDRSMAVGFGPDWRPALKPRAWRKSSSSSRAEVGRASGCCDR